MLENLNLESRDQDDWQDRSQLASLTSLSTRGDHYYTPYGESDVNPLSWYVHPQLLSLHFIDHDRP